MGILLPSDVEDVKCHDCGKPMPKNGPWVRPVEWFKHDWCCKHRATWSCGACYDSGHKRCPECGCGDAFT